MFTLDIIFRLVLSIIISASIGLEREHKNRPAGIRTHILVCVGATIVALTQSQITNEAIDFARINPEFVGIISTDKARLIAQVISGIGFLGAGTIIINKRSVSGLTTAATIWTVACLGISIGLGYYQISVFGTIAILIGLTVMKKIIKVDTEKKIEVKFIHRVETKEFLTNYFETNKVIIKDVEFSLEIKGDLKVYNNVYTIEPPDNLSYQEIIESISVYKNVTNIKTVNI